MCFMEIRNLDPIQGPVITKKRGIRGIILFRSRVDQPWHISLTTNMTNDSYSCYTSMLSLFRRRIASIFIKYLPTLFISYRFVCNHHILKCICKLWKANQLSRESLCFKWFLTAAPYIVRTSLISQKLPKTLRHNSRILWSDILYLM